jgi:hypothetical protein
MAGDSVEGRVMFANGDPIASQFTVNLPSAASQRDASVAGLLDGRYVVAFTDTSVDPGGDIRVRLFNPNGSPVGNGFAAAMLSTDESEADVAALRDGGFVVSWTRDFGAGDKDLSAAVYNADGSLRVSLPVNASNSVDTHASSVAGLAGGGFVVAYQKSPVAGGSIQTDFQLFNANGTQLYANNEILIDSYGSINEDIQVAGLPDGGFVVAYTGRWLGPERNGNHRPRLQCRTAPRAAAIFWSTTAQTVARPRATRPCRPWWCCRTRFCRRLVEPGDKLGIPPGV